MDLTFFYPTRTLKRIKHIERFCSGSGSGSGRYYLRKHVIKEKDAFYHVVECIGRKKHIPNQPVRDIFRHYIIPYYDYMHDYRALSRLGGLSRRYDDELNVNLVDKKYRVTTYQHKR